VTVRLDNESGEGKAGEILEGGRRTLPGTK
jgi:hypothetical protein